MVISTGLPEDNSTFMIPMICSDCSGIFYNVAWDHSLIPVPAKGSMDDCLNQIQTAFARYPDTYVYDSALLRLPDNYISPDSEEGQIESTLEAYRKEQIPKILSASSDTEFEKQYQLFVTTQKNLELKNWIRRSTGKCRRIFPITVKNRESQPTNARHLKTKRRNKTMNFLQTYRRHLIFKLAGIAAVILAVLSSAYLFMSADYARSVRKNTLALNERLTAQTATRIEASWDSLYNITTAFCYSPTVQQYFSVNSLNRLPDTQELASVFSNTILLNDRILSVYLYNADAKQIASMGKNFSIDTSVLNTDAVMDIRASHLKSNEKPPLL